MNSLKRTRSKTLSTASSRSLRWPDARRGWRSVSCKLWTASNLTEGSTFRAISYSTKASSWLDFAAVSTTDNQRHPWHYLVILQNKIVLQRMSRSANLSLNSRTSFSSYVQDRLASNGALAPRFLLPTPLSKSNSSSLYGQSAL